MSQTYEPSPEEMEVLRKERRAPDAHRMLPANPEAEQGILSSMLLAPQDICSLCAERNIQARQFHVPAHATIFKRVMEMWDKAQPIDFITVGTFLRETGELEQCGGVSFVTSLFTFLPTAANAEYYMAQLEETWLLREGISVCTSYASKCYENRGDALELIDEMEQSVLSIRGSMKQSALKSARELVMAAVATINEAYEGKGAVQGLSTGFALFDKRTGGLHAADMVVIAARPSMGKTALAMNIVEHVAVDCGIPVGVFSLEMSGDQLMQRLLCSRARVNLAAVRDGDLKERDFPALTAAASKIAESPLHIDDTGALSIQELRGRARRMKQKHNIGLLMIDYLQLLKSQSKRAQDSRQLEVSEVSGGIKALAKELGIPIIVLAQIDRGVEKHQRRPRLSDLRESGSIEQDADLVAFLTREEMLVETEEQRAAVQGQATLTIEKQRTGPRGDIPLTFLKEITRFETRAEEYEEEQPEPQLDMDEYSERMSRRFENQP